MAITKGYSFTATEQVTNAKLHALVDSATIDDSAVTTSKIADLAVNNAKISANAGIVLSKISTTSGKLVGGSATNTAEEITLGDTLDLTSSTLTVASGSIGLTELEDTSITEAKLATSLNLSSKTVTFADNAFFADNIATATATPAAGDYFFLSDVDDGDALKKATLSSLGSLIVNLAPAYSATGIAVSAAGSALSEAHSLGHDPYWIQAFLVCTSTDAGYAEGDVIDAGAVEVDQSGYHPGFISVGYDSSDNIFAIVGNGTPRVINKSTGSMSALNKGKWTLTVYAW